MKRTATFLVFILVIAQMSPAWSREISVLFLGNSYTHLPGYGTMEDPALPRMIREIAKSIDPELTINYDFNVPGGYSFERHYYNEQSKTLMLKPYDHVILQGHSIESLELTPWWEATGNLGVKSFSKYLPKILDIVFQNNSDVTMYVNWAWGLQHSMLADDHPGVRFPEDSEKADQTWFGGDKHEFQNQIDQSYKFHTQNHPVKLSLVGRAWLELQEKGIVAPEELYREDWSHATLIGGYISALVLIKDALGLDISKNTFVPSGMSPEKARQIQEALADNASEMTFFSK
ncbi:hypothetical protein ACLVWU_07160 [Bdellovibrio sp. HCB290]|uniref:hypothetical protein n=1 Tax=Bdellovibrio sp. HCB290 TaxID=3394356 RepID=UPI0039B484C4